jgi:hypothetical protein
MRLSSFKSHQHNESGNMRIEITGLVWRALARIALTGRPMEDWEKEDADEFFWLQFESLPSGERC